MGDEKGFMTIRELEDFFATVQRERDEDARLTRAFSHQVTGQNKPAVKPRNGLLGSTGPPGRKRAGLETDAGG